MFHIEHSRLPTYVRVMRSLALRLLALAVLLTLPFGMATAPAQSHAMPMAAASAASHCRDTDTRPDVAGANSICAMPCSAALPASDLESGLTEVVAAEIAQPPLLPALTGIVAEIATPPPKGA